MVLTLTEATAVPQPFWILVAEWMNLFGDRIEIPQLWPSGARGPRPTRIDIYIYRKGAYICILISYLQSAYFLEDFFIHSVMVLQPREGSYWEAEGPREMITIRFQIVDYLRCAFAKEQTREKVFCCCCSVCYRKSPVPMPVQRGGLQVQEREEQSRFLSVLWNHTPSRLQLCTDQCALPTRLQSRSRCT